MTETHLTHRGVQPRDWKVRLVADFKDGFSVVTLARKYQHEFPQKGSRTSRNREEAIEAIIRDWMNEHDWE